MKPIVALPLVAVLLGVAGWRLVAHARHKPSAEPVPIRCEACGHEFVPKPGDDDPICPKCGSPATLRLIYFRCEDCGETFVVYEVDPQRNRARVPGGEWMAMTECDFVAQCPKCGSERTYFVKTPDQPPETPGESD